MNEQMMIKEVVKNVIKLVEKDPKFNGLVWRSYDRSLSVGAKEASTFDDWKEIYVEGFVKNNIANVSLNSAGQAELEIHAGNSDTTFYVNSQNIEDSSNLVFGHFKNAYEEKFRYCK